MDKNFRTDRNKVYPGLKEKYHVRSYNNHMKEQVTRPTKRCLVLLINEITWNDNLIKLGNFIDVFLARHVSGTYAHHQEH